MTSSGVLVGSLLAVVGLCLVIFRRPVAAAMREARERRAMSHPEALTPTIVAVAGAAFVLFGLLTAIGTALGFLHSG